MRSIISRALYEKFRYRWSDVNCISCFFCRFKQTLFRRLTNDELSLLIACCVGSSFYAHSVLYDLLERNNNWLHEFSFQVYPKCSIVETKGFLFLFLNYAIETIYTKIQRNLIRVATEKSILHQKMSENWLKK